MRPHTSTRAHRAGSDMGKSIIEMVNSTRHGSALNFLEGLSSSIKQEVYVRRADVKAIPRLSKKKIVPRRKLK